MSTGRTDVASAFDAIAARLDQGIVEFESRSEIDELCRSLGMSLTDFADGLHDEMIYSLLCGDAETELVYTYMPDHGGYNHAYELAERLNSEVVRQRKWEVPSAFAMTMTDLSTNKLC